MVQAQNKDVTAQLSPRQEAGSSARLQPLMLGRFRLIALLGEGTSGKVLRAEDTKLKRHVALKCLKRKSDASAQTDELFVREARSAAALDHSGIVQVFEIGVAEGFHYIAMELIEGGTLAALIKGCGYLDLPRACQLCAEAAEALAYAADHGILHRDIKPENLLLTRAGRCKITDFGLAFVNDPAESSDNSPHAVGTPAYVAPEIIGGLPATEKSDVYSLAAVLFFLLAGKPPFPDADPQLVMRMQLDTLPPDVRTFRPELSEGVAKTLARALAKNPDDRPSAEIFAQQLRAFTIPLGDSQVLSVSGPHFPAEPPQYILPSSRWQIISLLAGTVAVIFVVFIAWVVLRNSPAPKTAPLLPLIPLNASSSHISEPAPTPPTEIANALKDARIVSYKTNEHDALLVAASSRENITVTGTVTSFHLDATGKIAILTFADNLDFAVVYREELFGWMTRKFGGKDGSGIVGKSIHVTGTPTLIAGAATITLPSTHEIELAP